MKKKEVAPLKKQTGVRLEADVLKQMKYLAVDLERPLASLIEDACRDYLVKHSKNK